MIIQRFFAALLLCFSFQLYGLQLKKICAYIACSLKQQKQCGNFLNDASKTGFLKKETKFVDSDTYHMSLIYVTPSSTSQDSIDDVAQLIKEISMDTLPLEGFTLDSRRLVYWGRLLVLEYESREFNEYHNYMCKEIKKQFPKITIDHEDEHKPHITLGSISCKKNAAWRQGPHEFELVDQEPFVVEKNIQVMVTYK